MPKMSSARAQYRLRSRQFPHVAAANPCRFYGKNIFKSCDRFAVSNRFMRPGAGLVPLILLAGCAPPSEPPQPPRHPPIHITEQLGCNKMIHYVAPVYPREARRKRVQGIVRLRVVIAKTGELRKLEAIQGEPLLVPAALDAARQWRYTPCIVNFEAVEIDTVLDIDFTLSQ